MYQKILVVLDNSRSDEALVPHVQQLAGLTHARVVLAHVTEGRPGRHNGDSKPAGPGKAQAVRHYLESTADRLRSHGLQVSTHLAFGDPPKEILKTAEAEQCDLIAMTMEGHRVLADIIHSSTINEVRHKATVPVLLVRAVKPPA